MREMLPARALIKWENVYDCNAKFEALQKHRFICVWYNTHILYVNLRDANCYIVCQKKRRWPQNSKVIVRNDKLIDMTLHVSHGVVGTQHMNHVNCFVSPTRAPDSVRVIWDRDRRDATHSFAVFAVLWSWLRHKGNGMNEIILSAFWINLCKFVKLLGEGVEWL